MNATAPSSVSGPRANFLASRVVASGTRLSPSSELPSARLSAPPRARWTAATGPHSPSRRSTHRLGSAPVVGAQKCITYPGAVAPDPPPRPASAVGRPCSWGHDLDSQDTSQSAESGKGGLTSQDLHRFKQWRGDLFAGDRNSHWGESELGLERHTLHQHLT